MAVLRSPWLPENGRIHMQNTCFQEETQIIPSLLATKDGRAGTRTGTRTGTDFSFSQHVFTFFLNPNNDVSSGPQTQP